MLWRENICNESVSENDTARSHWFHKDSYDAMLKWTVLAIENQIKSAGYILYKGMRISNEVNNPKGGWLKTGSVFF